MERALRANYKGARECIHCSKYLYFLVFNMKKLHDKQMLWNAHSLFLLCYACACVRLSAGERKLHIF